eukprot:Polyplicarium_translucidae@DN3150_c1_g1_i1.p4
MRWNRAKRQTGGGVLSVWDTQTREENRTMPATAGRVRMPANNRLSVSDSLRTSEIWQKSVGYDPYAPSTGATGAKASEAKTMDEKTRGLFALARLTGSSSAVTPGACKKCGHIGHLPYQCRNMLPVKAPAAAEAAAAGSNGPEADDDPNLAKRLLGEDLSESSDEDSSSSSSDSEEERRRRRKAKKKQRRDRRRSPSRRESRRRSPSASPPAGGKARRQEEDRPKSGRSGERRRSRSRDSFGRRTDRDRTSR